ncbi:integrin alpha-PS2 [Cherax quadricarinatus]|uniref:integrin alpha-PS2 n=1 Tax=Cherax quadricarinatus TaxID=27406 RepID=UPI00387E7F5C
MATDLWVLFVLGVVRCSSAFNIDIGNHVTHFSTQKGSMFGFDVAQHKDRGQSRLLIGAPKYDTEQKLRDVTQAGAVLQCSSEIASYCEYVPFDRNGNNVHPLGQQLDSKSYQWFGATVSSSGEDGIVVACAPRYVWFTENLRRREPVGTCYVARQGLTDFQEFSPCRTRSWGYHRQGSCQAGFDAVITKDGERMFIGAPGAFYWQGQAWMARLKGQVHSQSLVTRNEYAMTWEGGAVDDDQYLGYSVAVGDFSGDGRQDVALGVPKGLNYTGKGQRKAQVQARQKQPSQRFLGRRAEENLNGEEQADSLHNLTWPQWFEHTGFLFLSNEQVGYTFISLSEVATMRPLYGSFALAVGEFNGAPGQDLAVGIPRGPNLKGVLTGKIALYTHELHPLQNITGYQLGSYFGYSLAVVDFNNDGLDDIIVGSPMYTDYKDREMKFEVGRVHVMLQNKVHRFRQVVTFTGEVNRGRFGLSLTALGDINIDGIDDLAVGAPYSGKDGNGAVFIYHGFVIRSGELIPEEMKKPSQVIYAKDVSRGPSISTFGWSLSGGMDMDDNQYPDLLVGAYLSDAAVLLKSRPIVNLLNHSLTFLSEGKIIDIESGASLEAGCRTQSGRPVTCVPLEFCVGYGGLGVPEDIELDVEYTLDGKVNTARIFFLNTDQWMLKETIQLEKEIPRCQLHQVYVAPTLTDKLTPIGAEVKYQLVEPKYRRTPRSLTPILNQRQKLALSDSLTIQKNCGDDNVCIPDLILTFTAPDTFVFRKKEQLEVDVRVVNNADDAFEAKVYIPIPAGLLYNTFAAKDNTSVTCSPRTMGANTTLICDIGNPLPRHKGVHFIVLFQQKSGSLEDPRFEFLVTANSTNSEEARHRGDNVAYKNILVDVNTNLILYGSSSPENIEYNRTLHRSEGYTHEEHLGPKVRHTYGISNNGPSEILQAEIVILWPTMTLNGNYLLYLLEQPQVTGPVNCSYVPDVNPLGLLLNEKEMNAEFEKLQHKNKLRGTVAEENYTEVSLSGSDGEAVGAGETTFYQESSGGHFYSSGGNSSSSSSSSTSYSHSSTSSSSSKSFSSSSGSSSYSTKENDLISRQKRQANKKIDWESETTNCGPTKCTRIHCLAGPLVEDDTLYIYVHSRLVVTTLAEYPYEDLSITSRMVARVRSLPHGVSPAYLPVRVLDVTTPVSPAKSLDETPQVPWWVIVLATLAGILILLLIILILWKCGYFKRNRPEQHTGNSEDAQPLNPPSGRNNHNGVNGHNYNLYTRPYYPGDEAL